MKPYKACLAAALLPFAAAWAQTVPGAALSGKYFFRQVSLASDGGVGVADLRSLLGTVAFDASGSFSFTGQLTVGTAAATAATGSGTYSATDAGFVSMDNPIRKGSKLNARQGPEAVIGSGTEAPGGSFDLFVAVPAPASGAVLAGPFWAVNLEFSGASTATLRGGIFSLNTAAPGRFADFGITGHAANLGGAPLTQQVTGASYTLGADGSGSAFFGGYSTNNLLSGAKTLYVSASGNVILGGSTADGTHDIIIGVKAASGVNAGTWNGDYWAAGLRQDASGPLSFTGSALARGLGRLTWTRRLNVPVLKAVSRPLDFTATVPYVLKGDGSGTMALAQVGLGTKGFVGAAVDASDPQAFEIYFGTPVKAAPAGTLVLNPYGVFNGAGYAPAGNPVAPGEFLTLFGSGFAKSEMAVAPPYPTSLNGVTVTVNGKPAPLRYVGPGQINALVPFATQGPTATVVVENGGPVPSNAVAVPVAATAPGVFSLDSTGTGHGAVLHLDYSVVDDKKPAQGGETVMVFLTGMGTVTPPVADGATPGASIIDAPAAVLAGGAQADVGYAGMAPGYPGLYQLNVKLPAFLPGPSVPLAILTPNAYHDQVDIPVR